MFMDFPHEIYVSSIYVSLFEDPRKHEDLVSDLTSVTGSDRAGVILTWWSTTHKFWLGQSF